jgi:CheY-like chemotaxis protein
VTEPAILLVDDDEGVRGATGRLLQAAGYQVITVEHGQAALAVVQQNADVQLVLTDVRMPGISGLELGRSITMLRPDLPILYMTGSDPDLLLGPVDGDRVLLKPFKNDELLRLVAWWLPPARGAPGW